MPNLNFKELTAQATEIAQELHLLFGVEELTAGRMAKFIVLSREAVTAANTHLEQKGQELSDKGVEFILQAIFDHFVK